MSGSPLIDGLAMVCGLVFAGMLFGIGVGFGLSAADRLIPRRLATITINWSSLESGR